MSGLSGNRVLWTRQTGRRRRQKKRRKKIARDYYSNSTFTYIGSDRKYDYVRFGMGGQKGTWNQRGDESYDFGEHNIKPSDLEASNYSGLLILPLADLMHRMDLSHDERSFSCSRMSI